LKPKRFKNRIVLNKTTKMVTKTIQSCKLLKAVTVNEDDSVIEVAKKLHDFQERRVFVLNKDSFPIGIISVVDINDRVVARGADLKKTKAKDIMSYPIKIVLDINMPVEEAKKKMVLLDNYYCPVIEKSKLKGVLNYSAVLEVLKK
jgi:signal-transduction protein with cAMP-binding, CBS, and nucleotidyltransferase domain